MKKTINRLVVNWSFCSNFAIKWTGIIFTIWGIVDLFVPFDNLVGDEISWFAKLFIAILIVLSVFFATYVIGSVIALNKNRVDLLDVGDDHHVYVQYGDVFSPEILGKGAPSLRRNILISTNRCFDTIVDDNLITSCSLHGSAMNRVYESKQIDSTTLNNEIQKQLKDTPNVLVAKKDKPRGNLKRYSEGSVVEIEASSDITFFFLGLTSFDKLLHPYITDIEYVTALIKALEYCIKRNQGYPVIIPLIGGGRAGTKKEEKDVLEYLVKLIKLHRHSINCDIHIVVRDSAKESIAIAGLK